MRNKLFLLTLLMLAFVFTNAQKNTASLVSSSDTETVIKFNVNSYNLQTVETQNGKQVILKAEDASQLMTAEAPDLAKFTKSIIIPDNSKMKIEIVSSKFKEIDIETNIAPSKGNLLRNVNPNNVPYTYGAVYNQNEFFPGQLANLSTPYIARDYRGQAVNIYPFQYNPATKVLRIYTEITVKISATNQIGENVFNRTSQLEKVAREFNNVYSNHFLNYEQTRYTSLEEEGNMLIICHDDWTAEMQPLVDWKNTIGRPCEMVTVTEAGGTANAIATYVENYYNDNGLTYLLLVGDAAQVPTLSSNGDSDNAYAYITGNDHYLEFFVGRFSAESAADVTTQVDRTITYENGSTLADGWLNVASAVASSEGPGDDNEYDYAHARNMLTDLLAFTYVSPTNEIFDGSQGGNDAAGDATPTQVSAAVNSGTGIITYTGHGDVTYWVSSGFDSGDINNLTNDNKLPFIFDVACVNGAFAGSTTCFAEAWMRATNNGEPTGAIAICASTINQSWAPPMNAQDEMIDLIVGTSENGTKRTFTGIAVNGMFLMNDEDNDIAMTDTWTTFGDPSVLIRTDNTSDMVVTHNPTILVGQTEFAVNCDFDGGFACLSKDGVILGTATVSGGVATVPVGSVTPGDELTIAITGFNKVTYLQDVTVIAPTGPYITIDGFDINGGSSINYGQTQNIDITLVNVGPEAATSVTATLTTSDEYVVSLTNNNAVSFGTIAGDNGTASSTGSYTVELANNVPDGYIISFDLAISSTNKTDWNGVINVTANAPEFEITGMTVTNDDDNNGRLDPGETADLTFTVNNIGSADAADILASLSEDSQYFDVLDNDQSVSINANGTLDVVFSVEAGADAAEGTLVNLTMSVEKNVVYTAEFMQELTIGQEPMIVIGEGSITSDGYPFYTYYENNKTQMLYLGSEIGAGDILIQEIAFDFTNIDGTITDLTDLQINFKETSLTELGSSYDNMAGATNVLSSASYTMPQTNGWYSFDIDNFVFDANQNLIIEIIWGDNGAYGSWEDEYKLNCTSTDFTSVAYGYADSETPPAYDANSSDRPNVTMYFGVMEPNKIEEEVSNINIYPNPSNGLFNINLPNADNNIEIYNINGQLILSQKTSNSNTTVDLSSQAKGVYFVKITSDQNVYNQKIIIK